MPNNPTAQNRSAYDQIAARFAERNADMLPYVIQSGEKLLEMAKNAGSGPSRLLDLGCGTGAVYGLVRIVRRRGNGRGPIDGDANRSAAHREWRAVPTGYAFLAVCFLELCRGLVPGGAAPYPQGKFHLPWP